ncbi:hypothetical protein N7478_001785 [Penicillium angulare]|uniref:uncharacterized protein n=1 Tax=Penicillium angulare TaxID=116970 RepID=UPI0025422FDB|nr:uncharacterized protein N7478_001785 [Penicillium angulare]KAJ5288755.1 hypothetical protein N7478_001785 [Penicillium angulare]
MVSLPRTLIPAPRLSAALRLAQAVSAYEADLTRDQKEEFNHHRLRANEKPPSIQDVMRLTADIDEQLSSKIRGRCLGTRTTNFLQCVQQFTALGDLIVGGSQNLVASGVWALLILNFSSYFERISSLFMVIGRSAPRYEKLAILYPRSKELQSFLTEYFTIVVQLCHRILRFTQKSTLGRIGATLNDSDLIGFQQQLESRARDIKDEVNYLMAQRIEEQASFTTHVWSRRPSKEIIHQRQMKAYFEVLDFCSTYDYMSPWKQARRLGNTTLFHLCLQYLTWRERAYSSSLILTGRLGSGKSVLLANMVDDLNLHFQGQNTTVAFFFCRHDLPESLKPRAMIGSIARQLLWSTPDIAERASNYTLRPQLDDFETIRGLLQALLPAGFKAYLVIDGLDECEINDRQTVIQELRLLQQRYSICLCASVRKEPRDLYDIDIVWERFESSVVGAIPDNSSDIELFIGAELENRIKSGQLTIGNPLLILEIQDALLKGSQGMFLWVALQIDNLCTMCTDEAIRHALDDLPSTLSETFDRILRKFDSNLARSYQKMILEIIVAARYPLTPDELREALSVVPGETTWEPSKQVNDIFNILTCCGSLLTIDEEQNTIRLVHSSVRQFLIESESVDTSRFTLKEARKRISDIVITYLNYNIFETQLSTRVTPNIQVDSAPAKILGSNFEVPNVVRELAVSLLKLRRAPGFNITTALDQFSPRQKHTPDHSFRFLSYAKSNCLFHFTTTLESQTPGHVDELFLRLLSGTMLDKNTTDGQRLLLASAKKGIESILKPLLHSSHLNPNSRDSFGQTPIFLATASGHEDILTYLLSIKAVDPNLKSKKQQTPLHIAIENTHISISKTLIQSTRVNINAKDHSDRTPLHYAVQNISALPIFNLLLGSPSILFDEPDIQGDAPLQKALEKGNTLASKSLLSTGKVKTNTVDRHGITYLHLASKYDFTGEIVKILLKIPSTDPDAGDNKMITPLHQAVKSKNLPALKAILESGRINPPFRVNGRRLNPNKWTVMHAVAQYGDEDMTRLVLGFEQVDPNSEDYDGKTPLHYGCSADNLQFVKCMLEFERVVVNKKDHSGRTPLHVAFMHNSSAVADLLLASKRVDPTEKDNEGRTPFDYAEIGMFLPGD